MIKMDEKELRTKYIEFQMMDQQMRQIQQQVQKLDTQLIEVMNLTESLEDFKKSKAGDELLAPFANGMFVRTNLQEENKLLLNVGAGIVDEKDIEGAKKLIETQLLDISKYREDLVAQLNNMTEKFQELSKELESMQKNV